MLIDGEGFIFCASHKRGTCTVEQLSRVLYSPSLVSAPIQMNPLPPLFLKIRLKQYCKRRTLWQVHRYYHGVLYI